VGVATVAALAALTVAVAPEAVQRARERTLAHPLRSIGLGFVVLSALIGSGLVLAMTVVGLLLLPAAILFAVLGFVAGYVMGSYILGVGLWRSIGKPLPDTWQRKAGLAVLGAGVAGLIVLIPLVGWLIWLLLVFAGLGGIAGAIFGAKPQAA
jgi:hypothetical protein